MPIYQNVTYVHDELGKHKGYEYARVQNPTREALEANVASIESGIERLCLRLRHGGHLNDGVACSEAGEHVPSCRATVYGGTFRLLP